ncbi:hypothetical protein BpHYR1_037414 [Brachionus plicatilis]|uniref:Uncharacterized protein n=1 Tax=Brachionus plicatilis TaxID=10195 RepID=A0A3M7SPS2_BRAPC|nr:hypothetical protein BpHYR1_037414 [Brachionus plicatilis]
MRFLGSLKRLKLETVKSTKKGQMTPILPILHPQTPKSVQSHLTPFGASSKLTLKKYNHDFQEFIKNRLTLIEKLNSVDKELKKKSLVHYCKKK